MDFRLKCCLLSCAACLICTAPVAAAADAQQGGAIDIARPSVGRSTAYPMGNGVPAIGAEVFLSSLGINTHVAQGYDPQSYIEPLRYTGIRQARDGAGNAAADVLIHKATGVRFAISTNGNLEELLASAKVLAAADGLLAVEGPNEPNNFPITYQDRKGGGLHESWAPVGRYQADLYQAVKADPLLRRYPVFGPSEVGAEADNVGLQFLTVPDGAGTAYPGGTRFADYANVHNYVCSTVNRLDDNQAWQAADPTLNAHWDGLYGNHGVTWHGRYQGYPGQQLEVLPRVTTETGWDTKSNEGGERTQATILTNTYLAQFKRGWRYTFIYELRDNEGGGGYQGIYEGSSPKLSATYIHNLTSILSDNAPLAEPGHLRYVIANQPATVHDLLLQKSTGQFELVIWDERAAGSDTVTVEFANPNQHIRLYDVTVGTEPVKTMNDVGSVQLVLSDHAVILELGYQPDVGHSRH